MTWFSIKEISQGVFQITEPFWLLEPRFGLSKVHSYLVVGQNRAGLIDTGTGIGDLRGEITQLTDLPLLVLNTHHHWDHTGSNLQFRDRGIHSREVEWISQPQEINLAADILNHSALNEHLPAGFQLDQFTYLPAPATFVVEEQDRVDLGGISLTCLHTPGHTPGHLCFWLEQKGLLFTGDTAYRGPLYTCFAGGNPEDFRDSASRLAALPDLNIICPGHEALIRDPGWLETFATCVDGVLKGEFLRESREGFVNGIAVDCGELTIWLPNDQG